MRLHIPKQGNLFVVELTDKAIGDMLTLNNYALSHSVIDALSTIMLAQELKLKTPALLFGRPAPEAIELLKETAIALYIWEEDIDTAMATKRFHKHVLLASLFQLGYVSLEDLLNPKFSL